MKKPMSNRKKSLKILLSSIFGQGIAIAFGLLLPRLFVISYGSEVNGLLSSVNQFLVYLGLFEAGVGTATLQALYWPLSQNDWAGINGVMSATSVYYRKTGRWYFTGLLLLSVGYPLIVDSPLSYFTMFGIVFFSGIGNVALFYLQGKYTFLLQADGRTYILSNLSTLLTVLTSLLKVVLIYCQINIVLILACAFLIQCLQVGYILWYMHSRYPNINLNVAPNYEAISQKNAALVEQIGTLVFRNTDVLILTVFCGLRTVSVYSMFKLVTSYLESILYIPFNSVSFILGQTYQKDKRLYIKWIDVVESYYSALVYALFSVALFLFLPFMRLYTAGITDINYVDPWLAFLFVLTSLMDRSRCPMQSTITCAGHLKNTIYQTILEASLNLVISLIAVYFLGIYGVLLGTVVALAYRTNDVILYANHKLLERSAKKTYIIYVINIFVFLLTQRLFYCFFAPAAIDTYWMFFVTGVKLTILSLMLFLGAQTMLFPHCRSFLRTALSTWSNRRKP